MRFVGGLFLVGALLLTGCSSSTSLSAPAPTTSLAPGTTVFAVGQRPDVGSIRGTTLDGQELGLADLKGRVLVLNAWASYCTPCQVESPTLARLATEFKKQRVAFVGLDVKDDKASAQSFARFSGTTYPHIFDPAGNFLNALKVVPPAALPSTLIIDKSGKIAVRVIGPIKEQSFKAVLESVLSKS